MGFVEDVRRAAKIIQEADTATLISHIDADGITSEAIISRQHHPTGDPGKPGLRPPDRADDHEAYPVTTPSKSSPILVGGQFW